IRPEKIVPATVKLRNQPGSVVTAANVDQNKVIVPYQLPYQVVDAILGDIDRCKMAIDQATYADLFNAITNMPGIQPRTVEEIASRNE
ncbi:portal protein, partial [Salmonella enterica]|uniref:portal protein n=1 Tax=Salmonella enterica TaxID=28901 RepID=UPI0020C53875